MRLIEIELFNFKNFIGEHKIQLTTLNLFQGNNGSGKSSLILDSVLFALYGYSAETLKQLVCKGTNDTRVKLFLEHNNKTYSIERCIPSKLTILEDAIPIQGSIKVKQDFLNGIFHDIEWFRKFRLFDVVAGINLLEESKLNLRKTLLSFNENKLNAIRENLLKIKREREVYNKDNITVFPHFPSEKRRHVLSEAIQKFKSNVCSIKNQISAIQENLRHSNYKLGALKQNNSNLTAKIDSTKKLVTCPTCHQIVENSYKAQVEKEVKELIDANKNTMDKLVGEIEDCQTILKGNVEHENKWQEQIYSTQSLLNKLDQRLQQKQYIWTNKDVEVIKVAIKELDNFYSFYLTESVKSLEPVINHILNPIKFTLKFIINKKGHFDIILYKDNVSYTYRELSTGQKLMISIAFKMALLLEKGESGLIISDEGLSSLSENNLTKIFQLIQNFPFQLLSVVHRYETPLECLEIYNVTNGSVTKNV
jgi:DNA repair exonuclease SbcCD ATPase subunit